MSSRPDASIFVAVDALLHANTAYTSGASSNFRLNSAVMACCCSGVAGDKVCLIALLHLLHDVGVPFLLYLREGLPSEFSITGTAKVPA